MRRFVRRFLRGQSGTSAIEYGLIAALVAIVLVTTISLLGTNLAGIFSTIAAAA